MQTVNSQSQVAGRTLKKRQTQPFQHLWQVIRRLQLVIRHLWPVIRRVQPVIQSWQKRGEVRQVGQSVCARIRVYKGESKAKNRSPDHYTHSIHYAIYCFRALGVELNHRYNPLLLNRRSSDKIQQQHKPVIDRLTAEGGPMTRHRQANRRGRPCDNPAMSWSTVV